MTYSEAIDFLDGLRIFGTKPGLETAFRLAATIGNPQEALRFIHVAGTNGKGSTCAMLESIYRSSGLKVGLYTSPHLVSFCERIQVNRRNIPEPDLARLVEALEPIVKNAQENKPTFFEIATLLALKYFAEERCDLVIWETGLGGRLDATNIVTPLASVITNIDFDHVQWLGDTLGKIAAEKAGIIKPGIPVITVAEKLEALRVIREAARRNNAPLIEVSPTDAVAMPDTRSALKGSHQRSNAALALATVEVLQPQISISREMALRALAEVKWPGRFQVFQRARHSTVVLDGAHNPAGIRALTETLRCEYPNARFTIILGMLRDKSWQESVILLLPFAQRLLAVPVQSERTLSAVELAAFCDAERTFGSREVHACVSLAEALAICSQDALTIITGSLYLVGEAMQLLGMSAHSDQRELKLNEWSQASHSAQPPRKNV